MMERVEIGDAVLYRADCRDVLHEVGRVDALITDPPYGVGFTGKLWHSTNRHKTVKSNTSYISHEDSEENFRNVIRPALDIAIKKSNSALIFIADKSLWKLPEPAALGGIFSPAGTGLGAWGFQCFMHCAFYGRDPYLANNMGSRPTGRYGIYPNDANQTGHPCAKPIDAMLWAVGRASLIGHQVMDPFMGSGTTGVACVQLERKFIGIEIERRYFDIACRRIEEAQRQPRLPLSVPTRAVQEALDV